MAARANAKVDIYPLCSLCYTYIYVWFFSWGKAVLKESNKIVQHSCEFPHPLSFTEIILKDNPAVTNHTHDSKLNKYHYFYYYGWESSNCTLIGSLLGWLSIKRHIYWNRRERNSWNQKRMWSWGETEQREVYVITYIDSNRIELRFLIY